MCFDPYPPYPPYLPYLPFSIFSPLCTHSFQPPSIVFALVMPKAFMSSTARALVDSATQAQ